MFNNIKMPSRTVVQCGVGALATWAILTWLAIKPLGIALLSIFCAWVCKTYINIRIVPPPELQNKIHDFKEFIQHFRLNHPGMFRLITAFLLGIFVIIGHGLSCSTLVLIGLVIAVIISTRYNFRIIRINRNDFEWTDEIEVDDVFMPEENESNLRVLERASDVVSLNTPSTDTANNGDDDRSDEIPTELLFTDAVPEITENSTDDESDDLMPVTSKTEVRTVERGSNKDVKPVSSSAQANTDLMEFKKGHFKRDSSLSTTSSSSEESLSKGLKFPDHSVIDGPAPTNVEYTADDPTDNILKLSGNVLPNFMAGIFQSMRNPVRQQVVESSPAIITPITTHIIPPQRQYTEGDLSEDDFEIIYKDDVQ